MGTVLPHVVNNTNPAERANEVTKSDSISIMNSSSVAEMPRALYVGGGGSITLVTGDNDTVTLMGVLGGSLLPIRVKRVNNTGTSATDIVALF